MQIQFEYQDVVDTRMTSFVHRTNRKRDKSPEEEGGDSLMKRNKSNEGRKSPTVERERH